MRTSFPRLAFLRTKPRMQVKVADSAVICGLVCRNEGEGNDSARVRLYGAYDVQAAIQRASGITLCTSPPFALMHRLHTSNGNRVSLGHQVGVQRLGWRHLVGPGISPVQQSGRVVDGEVGRGDLINVVPCNWKRHGYPWPDPWAVGRHDGRTSGACRVEEHLALALVLDEGCRRKIRVDPLGAYGDDPAARGTNTCKPFAPLVFTAPAMPASVSAWRIRCAAWTTTAKPAPSGGSRSSTR